MDMVDLVRKWICLKELADYGKMLDEVFIHPANLPLYLQ